MCKAKSFLCVKGDPEPKWSPEHDSHEKLIAELKLKDSDLFNRGFVKIEYFPKNGDWFNPDDWEFHVDEDGTDPAWFEEEKQLWKDRCWEVIGKKILPALSRGQFLGDLQIEKDMNAKFLEKVGGDLSVNSSVTLPKLTTVGGYLSVNSSVTLPKLTTVGGYLSVYSSAKFNAPRLRKVNGKPYEVAK
jgi:hypothetical protein